MASSFPNKSLDRTGGVNAANNGNAGSAATPAPIPASDTKTSLTTVQTRAGEAVQLFQGASAWTNVTFILETAGPVAISHTVGVKLTNGSGVRLTAGVPLTVPVARGERIYCISGAVSRIQVIAAPIPWGEQLANLLTAGLAR